MRKRIRQLAFGLGIAAGLALLAGVLLACWIVFAPTATAITVENTNKIKPDMTLAEVEAILGEPARDELADCDWLSAGGRSGLPAQTLCQEGLFVKQHYYLTIPAICMPCKFTSVWLSTESRVEVYFDASNRAVEVLASPVTRSQRFRLW